ncbi:glycosyltransferase family 50 protein [Hymenopellis radicata]|nr:glycosyltransferase family 50 protein [Hymenopellis radicata]
MALIRDVWSFPFIILVSVVIRVVLILYSEWHDARSLVKYTDIDYRVFSDAAAYLLHPGPGAANHAQGPLKDWLGIDLPPYTRETYRYTPLLALLLAPNEWLHPSFGKYLFAACDIVNGILIYQLLVTVILPATLGSGKEGVQPDIKQLAARYTAIHLLNPMVFSISTRGSSESVLCLFVLLTLHAALMNRWRTTAVLLGISTHWKIYPGVYGLACLGVIGSVPNRPTWKRYVTSLVNWRTISFGLTSLFTFISLGAGCFLIWGEPFLQETYLYHLHRLDHRHNFSPYFYMTYLTYPQPINSTTEALKVASWETILRSPLVSFVPQMTLTLGSGLLFGRKGDLVFAWFVQTSVFVVFNKVCTSQYFLWYLLFLPLLLPSLNMSRRKGLALVTVWAAVQGLWLSEGYQLEFMGKNVFFSLWARGLVYVVGNCWVLSGIMDAYKKCD